MLDKHKPNVCLITVATSCEKSATDCNYKAKANFQFYKMLKSFMHLYWMAEVHKYP